MKLHKEGHGIIIGTVLFLLALNVLSLMFLSYYKIVILGIIAFSLVFFILILQFFRLPKRSFTKNEKYIVCPADGKVVVIEKTFESEFFKEERIQVSVFMSPLNVHANWYPMSGHIKFLRYHKGKKLVAWHPKASTENERTTIVIEKDKSKTILVRQIAGALANRIVYYPHEGDIIRQSSELGFIKFGSRVDVYLPLDAKINVKLNQKVTGGIDVLAMFS
jgi:phosphatidylserine decarboxylase